MFNLSFKSGALLLVGALSLGLGCAGCNRGGSASDTPAPSSMTQEQAHKILDSPNSPQSAKDEANRVLNGK